MRKPAFCICENKAADQLRVDTSTLVFATKIKQMISFLSLYPSSVDVKPGLCRTWSETPTTGFPATRLIFAYFSTDWRHRIPSKAFSHDSIDAYIELFRRAAFFIQRLYTSNPRNNALSHPMITGKRRLIV